MDRRLVVTGLAAAVLAAPALAQTSGSSSTATQSGQAMQSGQMGQQMGQAEMQHMQETMKLGTVALETSRMAQQKAQNAELKGFARFEVEEQQTIAEVLRSMMDPSATAAMGGSSGATASGSAPTVASPALTSTAAMPMDAQAQQMMQRMQQASGAEFDKMYLEGQLQGHRDLLQVQERYISSNPQNREHLNLAKMASSHIREHLAVLESVQQKMR